MRKILGIVVMCLALIFPLGVNAEESAKVECNSLESGEKSCSVFYIVSEPKTSVSVSLTEKGGADILSVIDNESSEFQMNYVPEDVNGVWNIQLDSGTPEGVSGEFHLLTFNYKVSNSKDCAIEVVVDGVRVPIPDEPEKNVQTGSTLPYIALGTIALIAVATYLNTKNKSKMYKI